MIDKENGIGIDVSVVGGGMITHDLILPTIYHLQRKGSVRNINICALSSPALKKLINSK
jgi:hypothetical protein